ncbi:hypothetical protein ACPCKW_27180 [Streptomyces griseoincarnatus]
MTVTSPGSRRTGRLLRAAVWWKTGSPPRATAVATAAGRFLGWALVAVGLYLVLVGAVFSGIWLVVIGRFVIAMATVGGGQAKLHAHPPGPARSARTAGSGQDEGAGAQPSHRRAVTFPCEG